VNASRSRLGYVLKRYPRYSETFVVTEILAHERAGADVEIFALRPPSDTHFQDVIGRVRAPVTYLFSPDEGLKAAHFWSAVERAAKVIPDVWQRLDGCRGAVTRDVYQALLLARYIRERDIGHLHAHFATSATTVARLAAHVSGVPFTFTAHAKDIFHDDVQPDDLRQKLNSAAAVVTVSDFNVEHLHRTYAGATSGVRRIYNGLELPQFPFTPPDVREPLIVGVGRLVEKKGFADLIDACDLLVRGGHRFLCQIVGGGELAGDLAERVSRLGLSACVQLVGPKPQRDVADLVGRAAVMAAPCIVGADGNRDGLPTVLLEAMALGTPCVSTDVTGIPEVLRDGRTGLLVPQHAPEALAAALARLLQDGQLRTRLAREARALIEAEFDTDRNATRLRELMHSAHPASEPMPAMVET